MSNVNTSYSTQLKYYYSMTTFRCPSDMLMTSRWLFTAPSSIVNIASSQIVAVERAAAVLIIIIIIIFKTIFMVLSSWQSHCESSPGSFDECRTAPSGHRPKTKLGDLGCESACTGCQNLHPPLCCIHYVEGTVAEVCKIWSFGAIHCTVL